MEHQPCGSGSIQAVAHNGAIQALGMRAMDTQLMSATSEGLQCDARPCVHAFEHAVTGHSRLT
jgi:hypothetical protein